MAELILSFQPFRLSLDGFFYLENCFLNNERIEKNEKEKNDDHPTCDECGFTLSCLWE